MFVPIVLIVVGGLMLLQALGIFTVAISAVIWPVVLMALGISLLVQKSMHCKCGDCSHCKDCKTCKVEGK